MFIFRINWYAVLPMHLQFMHHVSYHVHQQNCVQQLVNSYPLSLPYNKKQQGDQVAVTLKMKSKMHIPENFLDTGGCFKCNTYHITVLCW